MSSATYIPRDRRRLVTPEGVDLKIRLADIGTRVGALMIDLILINVTNFVLLIGIISAGLGIDVSVALYFFVSFILNNFYFMYFEMGRRAATPGKRILKIRVASRRSARLPASSVFARNAMREIEFFMPLRLMAGVGAAGVDGWIITAAFVWTLVLLLFPLFNKDRLRVGDLVAGTWVVRAPKPVLLRDLARVEAEVKARYAFSSQQIEAYGVKELHVLEDVLRARSPEILADVADRIQGKIKWDEDPNSTNDLEFLRAYYAALRGRLETRMLMGVRKTDKFDTR